MTDHASDLARAAERYRDLQRARQELTDAIRAAHADGVRQVDILRATDYVWTREQVRRVCLDQEKA